MRPGKTSFRGAARGVTVTAESPTLIERVKSTVTGPSGDYQLMHLRPGTYTVTFSLPGFKTVRREGIVLSTVVYNNHSGGLTLQVNPLEPA